MSPDSPRTTTTTAVGPGAPLLSNSRRWLPLVIAAGALVLALVIAFGLPSNLVFVITSVLIATVTLLGLGVVTGTAGMIALCQLSFAAVGAWVLEFLLLNTSLPERAGGFAFVIAMVAGAIVAAVFGIAVGLPALRLRGVNLAVITLGIAAAVDLTLQKVFFPDQWTNARVDRPFSIPFGGDGDRAYFLFAAVVTILVALGVHALQRSRWGAGWRAVAFSERGTASAGTSVRMAKLSAFAVSAFIGGLAGGLLVGQITQANYLTFQAVNSLGMYVLSIVVGAHLIEMALFGGILFVLIPELLKQWGWPQEWGNLVFAALGIQALTTNSNLGMDLRNLMARRQARRRGGVSHDGLSQLPLLGDRIPVPSERAVLDVSDLSVEFGALKALSNVNVRLYEGEILALIGPNGAGKSTFVDAVTGFLPQHIGEVRLADNNLNGLPPHLRARAGLRRTFQQDRVPTTMTVGAYVRFVTRGAASSDHVDAVLSYFGCPPATTALSRVDVGTRRLIEVAANIAARPQVLLLDEPAAGLSHEEHVVFGDRLRSVPQRFGVSLLIIEHDLDLVRSVCSRIVVLNFGEVLASGPQSEVLSDPRVLEAYMGETEQLS